MKKLMIGIGVGLLAAILACVACASTPITFLWTLSGDDASLGTSGGYHLYASKTSGAYTGIAPIATVAAGVSTVTVASPGLGTWYFVVTAFSGNTESGYSNEVSQTIAPGAPQNLKINIPAAIGPVK